MAEAVKVVVRCRPMNRKEKERKCEPIIDIDNELLQISISKGSKSVQYAEPKAFTFDGVYGPDSKQADIYNETAFPLVSSVLEGYNGTIFAYGQTGCGKTFTMQGLMQPQEMQGIIPHAFRHIFETINQNPDENKQFLVRAAYLEIYNEEVRDLLGVDPKAKLKLKEDTDRGVFVSGLTQIIVKDATRVLDLMEEGNKSRTVGATLMNADSSRSHSIFMLQIETSEDDPETGDTHIRAGKLNLVDLAGSERQTKTGASGVRLKEATKINLSLSALGNVISALVSGKHRHIPYRDSKLTRLLQDSLGGNTKTIMIAAVSPADYNYDETLSTLRYANRAKNIKNKPKINEDPKDTLLREYQEEIERLKQMLAAQETGSTIPQSVDIAGNKVSADQNAAASHHNRINIHGKSVQVIDDDSNTAADQRMTEMIAAQARLEAERQQSQASIAMLQAQIETERQQREQLASQLETHTQTKQQSQVELEQQLQVRLQQEQNRLNLVAEELEQRHAEHEAYMQRLDEQQMMAEREKLSLEEKLATLQEQLLAGGQHEEQHTEMKNQLHETAAKLNEERQEKARLREEQRQVEEAKLLLEENYGSLQEEVTAKTRKLKRLKAKYRQSQQEIKDLQEEFETEREDILDDLRNSDRQAVLYKQLLGVFMSERHMERVISSCKWDPESDEWLLPAIHVPVVLPTIGIATTNNGTPSSRRRSRGPGSPFGFKPADMTRRESRSRLGSPGSPFASSPVSAGSDGGAWPFQRNSSFSSRNGGSGSDRRRTLSPTRRPTPNLSPLGAARSPSGSSLTNNGDDTSSTALVPRKPTQLRTSDGPAVRIRASTPKVQSIPSSPKAELLHPVSPTSPSSHNVANDTSSMENENSPDAILARTPVKPRFEPGQISLVAPSVLGVAPVAEDGGKQQEIKFADLSTKAKFDPDSVRIDSTGGSVFGGDATASVATPNNHAMESALFLNIDKRKFEPGTVDVDLLRNTSIGASQNDAVEQALQLDTRARARFTPS
jgi:Kinesin motor domain